MSITAKKIIDLAKDELDYEEKKSASQLDSKHANAGKNNYTKYERDVFKSNGNYWCASFVSWLFYMVAGKNKSLATSVALCLSMSCETIRQAYIKAGRYDNTPKVGDPIFFKGTRHSGANHIGVVIKVTSTTVTTIEGNTSNKEFDDNGGIVAQKTYARNNTRILGYGHPKYSSESSSNTTTTESTTVKVATPTLKKGSAGTNVKTLQKNLNKAINSGLTVDGIFGNDTTVSVKKFQKKYGLTVDGIYGSGTAAKMKAVLK